jgi:hypothetical protein
MADKDISPKLAALRSLEESLHRHRRAEPAGTGPGWPRDRARRRTARGPLVRLLRWARPVLAPLAVGCDAVIAAFQGLYQRVNRTGVLQRTQAALVRLSRRRGIRIAALATGTSALVVTLALAGLWWRLTSGPIPLDLATPWLTAAVAENLGHRYQIEIGGTVMELDENRRMAIRMRDIVLRDKEGAAVASAPKAEAGFALATLLSGRPRVDSFNLVGAEIALRVETDGKVAVFAGADKRPIATSPVLASAEAAPPIGGSAIQPASAAATPSLGAGFAALLAWIDSLGTVGLDGGDLAELGLKSGNLVVDDMRNGRQSRFENIHLSLTRPQPGELSVTFGSQDANRPWVLVAAVKPTGQGSRALRIEARKISVHDILLALRLDGGQIDADVPVSASLRAEIAADGTPEFANGRILIGPGVIGETGDTKGRVAIDRLEANLEWDAARRAIVSPFQLVSGNTRMTLIAHAEAPAAAGGAWAVGLQGGSVVIAPETADESALLLNRILMRGKLDPARRRFDIQQGEAAGMDVNIAMSGFVDFATSDPRLVIGMAARKMSGNSFKRMWPPFVNPKVRAWVLENMSGGTLERAEVATNAPLSTLRDGGPPVPDDGLSVEMVASGTAVRVAEGLPPIRDTELLMRVRGRHASVALGRGVVEMPSGRRLTLGTGLFEVPDSHGKSPPARVRVRADGPVSAAAELLAMDRLREASGAPLDPAASRGNVSAQINLSLLLDPDPPKGSLNYNITADIANFAVDRFVMSQKIEAQTLRITANTQAYQFKGDVRIAGTPAVVEYRKARDEPDAEVRLQAVFDDAARVRFGYDSKGGVTGAVPIKLAGRFSSLPESENRFGIELDLTQAKIDNLLPGWAKPAGKPARAAFTFIRKDQAARFEDVTIEGSGAAVKGGIELDGKGELVAAAFPVFGLSDGDKATLKAERGADGLLKVTIRGEVFDGRAFVKSVMGGSSAETKQRQAMADFDLDLKVGVLAGFNGEALRAVELKLLARGGKFENFNLAAKLGVDTPLIGDLRARADGSGDVVYFETRDAGALFRFTDIYAKMYGGQVWVAMDPPNAEAAPRVGLLNVRDFAVRGESSLDQVAASTPGQPNPGVEFTRMRVDFTRSTGRMTIREGVVRGPVIGATIEGVIDYAANQVRMRGTFVPLYGLNNAFGQIPIVGMLLGGGTNEGLVGVTFEVVGTPGAPMLHINPISALTPGVLRKFLEFPTTLPNDRYLDTRSSAQP